MDLTPQQRDQFETFGFIVLNEMFSGAEIAELRAEVVRTLRQAYSVPDSPLDLPTGVDGFLLPMMGPAAPVSRALVGDRRLVEVAECLLDGQVAPKPAKGNLYRDASFWHRDSGDPDLRAIKIVTYLDPLTGPSGALRLLPGSHGSSMSTTLEAYRERWPWGTSAIAETEEEQQWPGLVVHSEPGDAIVFDVRLWHASLFGRDRLQWSVSYVGHPRTESERASARSYILSYLSAGHVYDVDAYPYFDPAWQMSVEGPFEATMKALDLPGGVKERQSRSS